MFCCRPNYNKYTALVGTYEVQIIIVPNVILVKYLNISI